MPQAHDHDTPRACSHERSHVVDSAFHRGGYSTAESRRIFCDEQGLFHDDDGDAIDDRATPLVAMSNVAGMPDSVVGVVRIWETEPRQWWGGRLGTHPEHRGDRTRGRPTRVSGMFQRCVPSSLISGADILVGKTPGAMTLTRTLCSAASSAATALKWISAAFDAE